MRETRVASRYAKSVLLLAIEKDQLDEVHADMKMVAQTCNESRDLSLLLRSPIIKSDKKQSIIDMLFKDKLSTISQSFVEIIVRKKREYLLEFIAEEFVSQYRNHKHITTANVTSAVKLDDTLKQRILGLVRGEGNDDVELVEKIDESIIGGFIVRIGDKQVDASLARKINRLKTEFSKNQYVSEL